MSTWKKGQELFVRVDTVMSDLQISKPLAYQLIKTWNLELAELGYTVIGGRVPRAFYEKKIYGMSDDWSKLYGDKKSRD